MCLNSGPALGQGGRLQASVVLKSGGWMHAPAATRIVNLAFSSWTHSSFRVLMPTPQVTEHSLHCSVRHLITFPLHRVQDLNCLNKLNSKYRIIFYFCFTKNSLIFKEFLNIILSLEKRKWKSKEKMKEMIKHCRFSIF